MRVRRERHRPVAPAVVAVFEGDHRPFGMSRHDRRGVEGPRRHILLPHCGNVPRAGPGPAARPKLASLPVPPSLPPLAKTRKKPSWRCRECNDFSGETMSAGEAAHRRDVQRIDRAAAVDGFRLHETTPATRSASTPGDRSARGSVRAVRTWLHALGPILAEPHEGGAHLPATCRSCGARMDRWR